MEDTERMSVAILWAKQLLGMPASHNNLPDQVLATLRMIITSADLPRKYLSSCHPCGDLDGVAGL